MSLDRGSLDKVQRQFRAKKIGSDELWDETLSNLKYDLTNDRSISQIDLDVLDNKSRLDTHEADFNNPHNVTPEQLGFTNKSELDKIDQDLSTIGSPSFEQAHINWLYVKDSVTAKDVYIKFKNANLISNGIYFDLGNLTSAGYSIKMTDYNVDLGDIATNASNIATNASNIATNTANINNHISDNSNPHNVTASQVLTKYNNYVLIGQVFLIQQNYANYLGNNSTSYVLVGNPATINTSNFTSGITGVKIRLVGLFRGNGYGTNYYRLYDQTSGTAISGTEISTDNSSMTYLQSGLVDVNNLTSGHTFRLQYRVSTSSGECRVQYAGINFYMPLN